MTSARKMHLYTPGSIFGFLPSNGARRRQALEVGKRAIPGLKALNNHWLRLPRGRSDCLMARVLQQQTLNRPASYSGVGLHSGNRVTMTFLPAPPNTGIRFRRVDLEGKPEIEARVENVVENNRSTTLAKGNTRIHTVEHVLATFAGYGIDNVIVELDANEPPIADGSSREYCKMVQSAGIVPQDERREPYTRDRADRAGDGGDYDDVVSG